MPLAMRHIETLGEKKIILQKMQGIFDEYKEKNMVQQQEIILLSMQKLREDIAKKEREEKNLEIPVSTFAPPMPEAKIVPPVLGATERKPKQQEVEPENLELSQGTLGEELKQNRVWLDAVNRAILELGENDQRAKRRNSLLEKIEKIEKAQAKKVEKQENDFYASLHSENTLDADAHKKTVLGDQAKGDYYKNKEEYRSKNNEKLRRAVEDEGSDALVSGRWEQMSQQEKEQYDNSFTDFKKNFISQLVEKRKFLKRKGVDISEQAISAMLRQGYKVEEISTVWFFSNIIIPKQVLEKNSDGKDVVVRIEKEKMYPKSFNEWMERMDSYERGLIDSKVEERVEQQYSAVVKKFEYDVQESRKSLLKSAFDAQISQCTDFGDLYAVLQGKGRVMGAVSGQYHTTEFIVRILEKSRRAVLSGQRSVDDFKETLTTNNQINQEVIMKASQLLREEVARNIGVPKKKGAPTQVQEFRPREGLGGLSSEVKYAVIQGRIAPIDKDAFKNYREELKTVKGMDYQRREEVDVTKKDVFLGLDPRLIPGRILLEDGETIGSNEDTARRRDARKEIRKSSGIDEILKRREEAFVECQNFVDAEIKKYPDATEKLFMVTVDMFAKDYSFSPRQLEILKQQIDSYVGKRKKFNNFWKENRDASDKEKIEKLTGKMGLTDEQVAKIKIKKLPTGVALETDSTTLLLLKKKGDIEAGKKIPGFASRSRDVKNPENNDIDYIVVESYGSIVERITEKRQTENKGPLSTKQVEQIRKSAENIYLHELQHVDYYRKNEEEKKGLGEDIGTSLQEYKGSKPEKKRVALEEYLKAEQRQALNKVKNEILACFWNDGYAGLKEKLENKFLKVEESRYNYFDDLRETAIYKTAEKENPRTVKRILTTDFEGIIRNSVSSLSDLVNKEKDGYTIDKAITFLTNRAFEFWPRNIDLFVGLTLEEVREKYKGATTIKETGEAIKKAKFEKRGELEDVETFEELRRILGGENISKKAMKKIKTGGKTLSNINKIESNISLVKNEADVIKLAKTIKQVKNSIDITYKESGELKSILLSLFAGEVLPALKQRQEELILKYNKEQTENNKQNKRAWFKGRSYSRGQELLKSYNQQNAVLQEVIDIMESLGPK